MEFSFAPINKIIVINGIKIQKELMHYPVNQLEEYLAHLDFKEECNSLLGTFRYYSSETCKDNNTTVVMVDQNGLVEKVKFYSNSQMTSVPAYQKQKIA
jgi:hypothetical protein